MGEVRPGDLIFCSAGQAVRAVAVAQAAAVEADQPEELRAADVWERRGRLVRAAYMDPDPHEWDLLMEEVEGRLFWDRDWETADRFLDLPPEAARGQLDLQGIAADYFTAVPDALAGAALDAARRALGRLTGPTAPDSTGP